jgi:DNA-binding response OmpR family regulator
MSSFTLEPPRILLIEKDVQVLHALSAALTEANFQIDCCRSEAEALEVMERQPPDAIISDAVLDHFSVREFREVLQRQAGMEDVPVMFLTPAQAPDIIRRQDDHGGTYYLRKPCEPHVLVQLLEQALDLVPAGK